MKSFKQRTRGVLHCLLALAALLAWMPGSARALDAGRTVNASEMQTLVQYASEIQMQSPDTFKSTYTAQVTVDGRTYKGYMISAGDPRTDGTASYTSVAAKTGNTRWLLYNSMPYQTADYVRNMTGMANLTETEIYVATFLRLMEIETGAREYNPKSVVGAMGAYENDRAYELLVYFRTYDHGSVPASSTATLALAYKGDGSLVDDAYYGPYAVTGTNIAATEPIALRVEQGGYSFVDANRANAITSVHEGQSFYVKVPAASNGETIKVIASVNTSGFDDASFVSSSGTARMVGISAQGSTPVSKDITNTWQRPSSTKQLMRVSYTYNNAYVPNAVFELYAGKTADRVRPTGSPLAALTTTSTGYVQTDYILTPGADYTIYQATAPTGYTYNNNVTFTASNNVDRINAFTITALPTGVSGQEARLTVDVKNASGTRLNGSVFEVFEGAYAQDSSRPGGGLVNPVARFTVAANGTYTSIGNEINSAYRYTIGKTYTIHELTTVPGYERSLNALWTPTLTDTTIPFYKGTDVTKDFEIKTYVSHINGVATNQTGNEATFTEFPVKRGDKVTYAVRLQNRSDITLRAARIIDEIPSGMSFYEADNVGLGWYRSGNALYFDSAASLAKGMQITYAVTLRVNDNAPITVRQVNTVKVDDLRNDQNIRVTPIKPSASIAVYVSDGTSPGTYGYDLALQKWVMRVNGVATGQNGTEVSPPAVATRRGDKVTYGIRIINQGTKSAIASKIADSLPAGLSFNPADNTNASWYLSNGKLYLDSSIKLNPNDQNVLELTLRVTDTAALGNITNAARIVTIINELGQSVEDEDSYLGDDFSTTRVVKDNIVTENGRQGYDDDSYDIAVITVTDGTSGNADLRVTKFVYSVSGTTTGLDGSESQATTYTVAKNSTIRWGIRIYNAGSSSAKLTQIIDSMPTGLAFLTGNAENNGWNAYGNDYAYTPNVSLDPGQYTTVYVTTKVLSSVGVQLTNNVEVKWDGKSSNAYASINVKGFEDMDKTGDSLASLIPVFIGGMLLLGGSATLLVTRRRRIRGKK